MRGRKLNRKRVDESISSRAPGIKLPSSSAPDQILHLQRSVGNQVVSELVGLQANASVEQSGESSPSHALNHPPPYPVMNNELLDALGEGEPMPLALSSDLKSVYGSNLGRIRIHDDAESDYLAKALGAKAFSVGNHIGLAGNRSASSTRQLLRHESAHLMAHNTSTAAPGRAPVQLATTVDDVTEEMVGQSFTLRSDQGSGANAMSKGSTVVISDWKGTTSKAKVTQTAAGKTKTLDVPKLALEPITTTTKGLRRYTAGIGPQQTAVEKAAKDVATQSKAVTDWKSKEGSYRKNRDVWTKSLKDLEDELARRETVAGSKEKVLSRLLVRETMYNRFDTDIAKWVNFYNTQLKPDKNLDPSIVKSMLFQETRMGTEGQHLELPPYDWTSGTKHPVRSRFNVGQAIDSASHQQLLMIKEMDLATYSKHKLDELEKEDKAKGKTEAEMFSWRSGTLNKAMREFFEKRSGGKNLMGASTVDLHLDYAFWIRTAIRWLFFKYLALPDKSRTWEEAVRAYNGTGPGAVRYKKGVMKRVGGKGSYDASSE